MKLYYSPGACSLSPHIVLCEGGFEYTTERVDLKSHRTEDGADFYSVSDKGAVPYLVLDNGEGVSEGVAIVQYLADLKPEAGLAPQNGTMDRTRLQEWLNYIATDLHKSHSPIFHADKMGEQAKLAYIERIKGCYAYVSAKLEGRQYLMGDQFTVADAYLFTVLRWHKAFIADLSAWPVLVAYMNRVAARPAVRTAMEREGLLQKAAA